MSKKTGRDFIKQAALGAAAFMADFGGSEGDAA